MSTYNQLLEKSKSLAEAEAQQAQNLAVANDRFENAQKEARQVLKERGVEASDSDDLAALLETQLDALEAQEEELETQAAQLIREAEALMAK